MGYPLFRTEISPSGGKVDFSALYDTLLGALRARLASGEVSERRMAQLVGISQPHMHNVLKGVRFLSPEIADRIIRQLGISLLELFPEQEIESVWRRRKDWPCTDVPVLEGCIGPGLPLPTRISAVEKHPFPRAFVRAIERPVLARVALDPMIAPVFAPNDLVLLDRSTVKRSAPQSNSFYVINRHGEGLIRRLRVGTTTLGLLAAEGSNRPRLLEKITLGSTHILDVVRAKVVWLGRYLDGGSTGLDP